jgi:hypothetical protein
VFTVDRICEENRIKENPKTPSAECRVQVSWWIENNAKIAHGAMANGSDLQLPEMEDQPHLRFEAPNSSVSSCFQQSCSQFIGRNPCEIDARKRHFGSFDMFHSLLLLLLLLEFWLWRSHVGIDVTASKHF